MTIHMTPTGETKAFRLAHIALERLGKNTSGSSIVARAMAAIDPERVSSAAGIVKDLAASVEQTQADRDLSDHGKQTRIEAAATSRLGNLARVARTIVELEGEHETAKAGAVRLEKPDHVDMLLDLALAAHVKAEEPIPTLLLTMSERVRVAVARVPVELTGITPETQARVAGSLVSLQLAARFAEEVEALGAARTVVQASIDELVPLVGWKPAELVKHFGAHWKLPGVTMAGAVRLAADAA